MPPRADAPPPIEAQIGLRLRQRRHARAVTLDQLASEVGLTKSQVSRIENGKVSSPVSTLTRLAAALGIPVGELFDSTDPARRAALVRLGERTRVVGRASKIGHIYESLAANLPFRKAFEPYLMIIEDRRLDPAQNSFQHPGQEFLHLLAGTLVYRHGGELYPMAVGDSLYFDGSIEHGPQSVSDLPVKFLCIIENVG